MNKQILLQVKNGLYPIDAKIIGALGVHDSPAFNEVLETRVSHVKTGCFIAAFTSYTDAVDFATKANQLLDFDKMAEVMLENTLKQTRAYFKQDLATLHSLMESYSSYIPRLQLTLTKPDVRVIRKRLKPSQELTILLP
jgi:hypothetical protein